MPAWHPITKLSSTACLRQTAEEAVRASHALLQQQAADAAAAARDHGIASFGQHGFEQILEQLYGSGGLSRDVQRWQPSLLQCFMHTPCLIALMCAADQ